MRIKLPRSIKPIFISVLILAFIGVVIYYENSVIVKKQAQGKNQYQNDVNNLVELRKKYADIQDQINKENEQAFQNQNKDIITLSDSPLPIQKTCEKLRGIPGITINDEKTCNYSVRAIGKLTMAVVIIEDKSTRQDDKIWGRYYVDDFYNTITSSNYETSINYYDSYTSRDHQNNVYTLNYLNKFINDQAQSYGLQDKINIELKFLGPYYTSKDLVGPPNKMGMSDSIDSNSDEFIKENNINLDEYYLVHYIYIGKYFRSMALPGNHKAYTSYYWPEPGVFIHETMHLLGANDKYYEDPYEYKRACPLKGYDPFNTENKYDKTDVMCSSFFYPDSYVNVFINKITAREIGWPL